ncbi:MAG: hypothetical protein NT027_17450 [Proteobacteria bacterium]|nr:hypothetical protein [Pseudomonadota bacterium]
MTDGLEDIPGSLDVYSLKPRCTLIHTLSSLELSTDWMESETCYLERTPTRKDYLGKQLKQGGEFAKAINDWKSNFEESTRKLGFEYFHASDITPALSLFHFVRERAQI